MWVNVFFAVSAVSLLLFLFSFGALLAACCHRSKKAVDSSPESTSIEMVPSHTSSFPGDESVQSSGEGVSKNPFDGVSDTPSLVEENDSTNRSVDDSAIHPAPNALVNPVENPSDDSSDDSNRNPFTSSSNNPFNVSSSNNPFNTPSTTNPIASSSPNPFNNSSNSNPVNTSSTNPFNHSINPINDTFNHSSSNNPSKPPTGLAALMGLADTSFSPTLPPKPSQSFASQRDETPAKPERSPPQLADTPFSRPHRPAPILDNVETTPMLPPKPVKPPKPAKLHNRTSVAGTRFIPCPEWMALTTEEKETEEAFLKRLSHRNIAKVGLMGSCHVVCWIRKEGRKGLSRGRRRRTVLGNISR